MTGTAQNQAQNPSTWHRMTPMQVAQELGVNPAQGLSAVEATARLRKYGPNLLSARKNGIDAETWARLYRLSLPITLLVAALLSLLFSFDPVISLLLAGLAILSILVGVYQDVNVHSNSATRELAGDDIALVRRDGQIIEIDATRLVLGDIVILTAGSRVPADGRLYIAARLSVDESALTGVKTAWKETTMIEKALPQLGDRSNMAFMNSKVTHGYGVMIVTGTGTQTEKGRRLGLPQQYGAARQTQRESFIHIDEGNSSEGLFLPPRIDTILVRAATIARS